jgi:Lrp/AsnC family transcriptional regulator for asnA, asnC and gidA
MARANGSKAQRGGVRSPATIGGREPSFELTELDRRMIRMLQADGRKPFTEMANELGIVSRTVRRRVERLRADGIIQITTVADHELLGYSASAMVGIRCDGSAKASEVASRLAALEAVDYVVVSTGRYELLAEVLCTDTEDLITTLEEQVRPVSGVADCESFPYLRLYYQEPIWDAAHAKLGDRSSAVRPIPLDELDRRVIIELNLDGRASFRAIASAVGASESLVRQRVGRLTGAGAIRVMAITNPLSLGFRMIAWFGIGAGPKVRLEDLADRIADCKAISYLAVCAGRYDVLAEAVCTDREDLLRLLDEEIRPMAGVDRVEVFVCTDLHYRGVGPRFSPRSAAETA